MKKHLLTSATLALILVIGPMALSPSPAQAEDATGADAAPPIGKAELGDWGVDLSARSETTKPGDDFFHYANGTWLDTFDIPADRTSFGAFTVLRDRSEERVKTIIDDLASSTPVGGSEEAKVATYFNNFMDVETLNARGITPLNEDIATIQAIADRKALTAAFGRSTLDGTRSPIGGGVGIDRKNPNRYQVTMGAGGLGLPDRDYYLEDTERFAKIRSAYEAYIEQNLGFAGLDTALAGEVLALETKIAEQHWKRADRRDRDKTYNPHTVPELSEKYPDFDWATFLSAAQFSAISDLNISHPSAFTPLIQIMNATSLDVWKAYLVHHLVSNHASLLSEDIDAANFAFYGKALRGQPEQRERWKRAVAQVGTGASLGEVVGKVYAERHFPETSKTQMVELVENLRTALRQRITGLDWMGDATKEEAYKKLEAFLPRIGFPDKWRDFSALDIASDDLVGNAKAVRTFNYQRSLDRLDQPTERLEWGRFTPQTVNASYNPLFNQITFPAGILEAPFFDPNADPAVNYGAIGAVIGHEMGHGFDDQGSKSDFEGIQRNWWTDEDRARFEERAGALADQYSQFSPVEGAFVDGRFTLGENIGDLGGLSMAYHAYKLSLNGKEAPVIDGYTGDQRFFLAWAQVWKRKSRDAAVLAQLKSDPHSPSQYRVNGIVRNMDAWYEAFNVGKDDALYIPPEDRVRIW